MDQGNWGNEYTGGKGENEKGNEENGLHDECENNNVENEKNKKRSHVGAYSVGGVWELYMFQKMTGHGCTLEYGIQIMEERKRERKRRRNSDVFRLKWENKGKQTRSSIAQLVRAFGC